MYKRTLSVCLAFGAMAAISQAQLTPEEKILETMKEVQGQVMNSLARCYGPGIRGEDGLYESISLSISTSTSGSHANFLMKATDQTWQAQLVDFTIAGNLDLTTGTGSFSSDMKLGPDTWNHDGTFVWNFPGEDELVMDSMSTNRRKRGLPDEHSWTYWTYNFSYTLVIHTMNGVPTGERSRRRDFRHQAWNAWLFWQQTELNTVTDETFAIWMEGLWDGKTGIGQSTVEIVPEPATLSAVGIGLAAVLRRRRRN
jgi:hypothetical protein